MWLVKLALRSPYTFLSLAVVLLIVGILVMTHMQTDIFPEINVPVISVIWAYPGLPAAEMQERIGSTAERAYTAYVNDIEHTETQSINGICLLKVFLHSNAKIDSAVSQLSATSQFLLRVLPPGLSPPVIIRYNASSVPILQLAIKGNLYSEEQLYDYGISFIRPQLATQKGATVLVPLGGKSPQISIDLDIRALAAHRLAPSDVLEAVNLQNLILPSGFLRSGGTEYAVSLNGNPASIDALNDLPLPTVDGRHIRLRDVGYAHEGAAAQTNIVRVNGQRSTLIPVLKGVGASTLDIVRAVRKALPRISTNLPKDLDIRVVGDQSVFVRSAIRTVLIEGIVSVVLASSVVLVFLGNWRSTLPISVSIPLSAIAATIALYIFGYTLNVMTLGGLSLAVGLLVDDATVEIENIHRHRSQGKSLIRSILDGAQEIALPTFASTLAVCIAFVPVIFLSGTAQFLFTPMALAVIFAMCASYLLSRTVVPTLARFLLGNASEKRGRGVLEDLHLKSACRFLMVQTSYKQFLSKVLSGSGKVICITVSVLCISIYLLATFMGRDFFPVVDTTNIRLHVRAEPGTRLENTEEIFQKIERVIREVIPASQIDTIVDNFGLPELPVSLAFSDAPTISSADGEILISLKNDPQQHSRAYLAPLRQRFKEQFPDVTIFFQPGDMVNQILDFGLPAPIDVQLIGSNQDLTSELAQEIAGRLREIPGLVDVYVHQVRSAPAIRIDVDRVKASQFDISERDVAEDVLISLSSSGIVYPNYWLNPSNGLTYLLAVQDRVGDLESVSQLAAIPLAGGTKGRLQLLGNLARTRSAKAAVNVTHYGVLPVVDVYANVFDIDLAHATVSVEKVLDEFRTKLPPGASLVIRGQAKTMQESFGRLAYGFLLSALLVLLLLVITFQSIRDAALVLLAAPGAIAGALLGLLLTDTTVSIPAMLGTLMSVGIGTANGILLVIFARAQLQAGVDAKHAALEASVVRLRPILMTSFSMLCGMLPMALGLGEGAEQTAPLGRAAFGGLVGASVTVLLILPMGFSVVHKRHKRPLSELDEGLLHE